ncbi:MAG TPA: hypothetical protein VHZ49_18610 [Methylomirabilota bacterium]|jgi:hypothetical protein|nr:hypothetical protein [Methylomirabilota bacterium]
MKAIAVSLMLIGLVAGCARHHASSPSASPSSITSKSQCQRAGYTWDATSNTCQ